MTLFLESKAYKLGHFRKTENLMDRAMARAVSHRLFTAEARFRARVSPCGICGGQSGTGTGFYLSSSAYHVNIIQPWLYILVYQLGDGQQAR
jgi:hypothetical protein